MAPQMIEGPKSSEVLLVAGTGFEPMTSGFLGVKPVPTQTRSTLFAISSNPTWQHMAQGGSATRSYFLGALTEGLPLSGAWG